MKKGRITRKGGIVLKKLGDFILKMKVEAFHVLAGRGRCGRGTVREIKAKTRPDER